MVVSAAAVAVSRGSTPIVPGSVVDQLEVESTRECTSIHLPCDRPDSGRNPSSQVGSMSNLVAIRAGPVAFAYLSHDGLNKFTALGRVMQRVSLPSLNSLFQDEK